MEQSFWLSSHTKQVTLYLVHHAVPNPTQVSASEKQNQLNTYCSSSRYYGNWLSSADCILSQISSISCRIGISDALVLCKSLKEYLYPSTIFYFKFSKLLVLYSKQHNKETNNRAVFLETHFLAYYYMVYNHEPA